jgi:small GTP-binding protein
MNDKFIVGLVATIGIDNEFQCVQLTDGSIIKLRVLDTAGQEIYNSINENYYKDADGCLLVYDITNNDSFERIKDYYIQKIKDKCKKKYKNCFIRK